MSILFPDNNTFDRLFLELAESVKDMVKLYEDFSKDYKDFEKYANKAAVIEWQADDSAHKILSELQTAFITPYDREDLHALVVEMDDIVDVIENVIQWFYIYNIVGEKKKVVDEFGELFVQSAEHLVVLVKALFGKKKHVGPSLTKTMVALHTLESQGDKLYLENIRELFTTEKDPIEIVKWRRQIENMEEVLDVFEQTANTVESIKLKAD